MRRRGGRELEHGLGVAGLLSVMGKARRIGTCRSQRPECSPMERDSLERADGLPNRHPCELVSEGYSDALRHQDPGGEALVEALDLLSCERL
jgi:hypothetical protein